MTELADIKISIIVFLAVVVLQVAVIVWMKIKCRRTMMRKNRALVRQMREQVLLEKRLESATIENDILQKWMKTWVEKIGNKGIGNKEM